MVRGGQGARKDNDVLLLCEGSLHLRRGVAPPLHVFSETFSWLFTHALLFFSNRRDLIIEFVLLSEQVGKVSPLLGFENLDFGEPG